MINKEHNSPWDRGSADSWYGRPRRPHKWIKHPNPSVRGEQLMVTELTEQEVAEYHAGYDDNEAKDFHKEW